MGIKYFSSSLDKAFITDQKDNPKKYKYKIIRIFDTREEAMKLEIKLHNKFNVGINESFYNRAKATTIGFSTSGIKFSEEYKKNMSNIKTGIKMSNEFSIKVSEGLKGIKKSDEHKANISKSKIGHVTSDKTKEKLSNITASLKWINNITCNKRVNEKVILYYLIDGWKLGKK